MPITIERNFNENLLNPEIDNALIDFRRYLKNEEVKYFEELTNKLSLLSILGSSISITSLTTLSLTEYQTPYVNNLGRDLSLGISSIIFILGGIAVDYIKPKKVL
jgi:hypothetical protein